MSNFQDNPSVGNPNNKIDGENETPLKWAYEMDKTQFKYRCPARRVTMLTAMVAKSKFGGSGWMGSHEH